jgi:hypothetical protein
LEINIKHLKFFRFRSPAYVKGEVDGAGWIFNSIEWLDFDSEMFLNESYVVMQISNGGYSHTELRDMDFNDYEMIIRITKPLAEKMTDTMDG